MQEYPSLVGLVLPVVLSAQQHVDGACGGDDNEAEECDEFGTKPEDRHVVMIIINTIWNGRVYLLGKERTFIVSMMVW
jgi:hypothetical protein